MRIVFKALNFIKPTTPFFSVSFQVLLGLLGPADALSVLRRRPRLLDAPRCSLQASVRMLVRILRDAFAPSHSHLYSTGKTRCWSSGIFHTVCKVAKSGLTVRGILLSFLHFHPQTRSGFILHPQTIPEVVAAAGTRTLEAFQKTGPVCGTHRKRVSANSGGGHRPSAAPRRCRHVRTKFPGPLPGVPLRDVHSFFEEFPQHSSITLDFSKWPNIFLLEFDYQVLFCLKLKVLFHILLSLMLAELIKQIKVSI